MILVGTTKSQNQFSSKLDVFGKTMKTTPNCARLLRYSQKTFDVNFEDSSLMTPLKHKSYRPSFSVKMVVAALFCGRNSARSIQTFMEEAGQKIGKTNVPCRACRTPLKTA